MVTTGEKFTGGKIVCVACAEYCGHPVLQEAHVTKVFFQFSS